MFDEVGAFPRASGEVIHEDDVLARPLTFSGAAADVSSPYGWYDVHGSLAAFAADRTIPSIKLAGYCAAIFDGGWRDAIHAVHADVVVIEAANGATHEEVVQSLQRLGVCGLVLPALDSMRRSTFLSANEAPEVWASEAARPVVQNFLAEDHFIHVEVEGVTMAPDGSGLIVRHAPLPVLQVILPLAAPFHFFDCCNSGRFEALATWHEMVAQLKSGLGLPVMPGDTSPARAFAFGSPATPQEACVISGALLNAADWTFDDDASGDSGSTPFGGLQ